jgi:hypothetical protein
VLIGSGQGVGQKRKFSGNGVTGSGGSVVSKLMDDTMQKWLPFVQGRVVPRKMRKLLDARLELAEFDAIRALAGGNQQLCTEEVERVTARDWKAGSVASEAVEWTPHSTSALSSDIPCASVGGDCKDMEWLSGYEQINSDIAGCGISQAAMHSNVGDGADSGYGGESAGVAASPAEAKGEVPDADFAALFGSYGGGTENHGNAYWGRWLDV